MERSADGGNDFLLGSRTVFVHEGITRVFTAPFGRHVELDSRHIVDVGIIGEEGIEGFIGEGIVVLMGGNPAAVQDCGMAFYSGFSEVIVYSSVLLEIFLEYYLIAVLICTGRIVAEAES